jgi:cardiolipin synthase
MSSVSSTKPASLSRLLSERALARTAGAQLITGNKVRILKDAQENYPAWHEAIKSARKKIYFESYIIHEDDQGREFAEALAAKAREGVKVRLIYDWMGAIWASSSKFWKWIREAGIDARCFNPPRFDSPFGWIGRDHRKMIAIDGRIGFITGLCVGRMWAGDPARGIEPWRDTGVEVIGPAVADIEQSFAQMWATVGDPLPEGELIDATSIQPAGDMSVRVVAGVPNMAGLYRLDQMVAAAARENLWLTDAYFAGTTAYVQALRAAAMDGVDVRLLVPQATDIPGMRALSRSGYRPLLEAGVRVFEWNGPMIHAKTAVSDGRWARVGSTNLNLASWIGNWELDLVVEDERFGQAMEQMYLKDLENSTEIILTVRRKPLPAVKHLRRRLRDKFGDSSSGRAAAGAVRIGNMVGAAITNRRILGPAEARITSGAGILLLALSALAVFWPRVITVPLAVLGVWVAASLFIRAYGLYLEGKREEMRLTFEEQIHRKFLRKREGETKDAQDL